MKSVNEITTFLRNLSMELIQKGADLSVMQFGSSIDRVQFEDQLDIDLLLLTSEDHYKNFSPLLRGLKQNMLNGKFSQGFSLPDQQFIEAVQDYLAGINVPNVKFIPEFVFGPKKTYQSENDILNVYLHFKGPLTPSQFIEFGNLFPFHAKSILQSSRVLAGEFNIDLLSPMLEIDDNAFKVFSNALTLRIANSQNNIEIRKCIKKLLQNYDVLQVEKIDFRFNVLEILEDLFRITVGNSDSTEQLKAAFLELKRITDESSIQAEQYKVV